MIGKRWTRPGRLYSPARDGSSAIRSRFSVVSWPKAVSLLATQWVVFEPNNETLWTAIRLRVDSFMHDLFLQGAFHGETPERAYFVRCDRTTMSQTDVNEGIVNIVVGFAPLESAEFVVIQISQITGEAQSGTC